MHRFVEEMSSADASYWDRVHREKNHQTLSWVRDRPVDSIEFLKKGGLSTDSSVIDLGAGVSNLADHLLELPVQELNLVDISAASLEATRLRLKGHRASARVRYTVADLGSERIDGTYTHLHDRAVLHFLKSPSQRKNWLDNVERLVAPGGRLVVATFADDGPEKCSGLPVQRYSRASLEEFLAPVARADILERRVHLTPTGTEQPFVFGLFTRA